VAQAAGRFGLSLKSQQKFVLCSEPRRNYLHRHRSRRPQVDREEYCAHSTFAKLPLDPILSIQDHARQRREVHILTDHIKSNPPL
jgi:hypothetical protein